MPTMTCVSSASRYCSVENHTLFILAHSWIVLAGHDSPAIESLFMRVRFFGVGYFWVLCQKLLFTKGILCNFVSVKFVSYLEIMLLPHGWSLCLLEGSTIDGWADHHEASL